MDSRERYAGVAASLMAWASGGPSAAAKSVVSDLSDVHAAAHKVLELIDALRPGLTAEQQSNIIGQLEVWLFDELLDRLVSLRPSLERISMDVSDATG